MSKQCKSEALAAVYETALGLHEAGILSKEPLKIFDKLCLTQVEELRLERTDTANPAT